MIYYKEEILQDTENLVFFDIDGTLSSSNEWQLLMKNPKYKAFKESFYKEWETIKFIDFKNLNHTSIALFANLLRQTNSKAVCISSWNIKGHNISPNLYIQQLQEAFQSIYEYFPDNWLLGYSYGEIDRNISAIQPFIEKTHFDGKYITLDDGGFQYLDQSLTVIVNSRNGFNHQDYEKALKLFNIKEEVKLLRD